MNSDDSHSFRIYLREIGRKRLLTRDEENELAFLIQARIKHEKEFEKLKISVEEYCDLIGIEWIELDNIIERGWEARNKLIEHNLRLVVAVARTYNSLNMPLYDLVQEGNFGLIKGVERFDPTFNVRLSTYVTYWIKESINRGISKTGRIIKIPVHVTEKLRRVRKANKEFFAEYGRDATILELCKLTGVKPHYISRAKSFFAKVSSLNTTFDNGEYYKEAYIDSVVCSGPTAEEALAREQTCTILIDMLDILKERDKNIMIDLYGLTGQPKLSSQEVADKYGLCLGRVKQLEKDCINKLRLEFTAVPDVVKRIKSCLG